MNRHFLSFGLTAAASALLAACGTVGDARPQYATRMDEVTPAPPPPPTPANTVDYTDRPEPAVTQTSSAAPAGTISSAPIAPVTSTPVPNPVEPAPATVMVQTPPPPPPPTAPARPVGAVSAYVVQPGDTLTGVGRRFGVTLGQLIELNALGPDGAVRAGQRVLLPATAADKGPEARASGPAPTVVPGSGPGNSARPTPPAERPASPPPAQTPPAPAPTSPPTRPATPPAPTPRPATPPAGRPPAAPTNAAMPTTEQLRERARGVFAWPLEGELVASFGVLGQGIRNDGINIAAPAGTPVKAAADGEVVYRGGDVPGLGNFVLIKHADGWATAYAFLQRFNVTMGQQVKRGDVIGAVGTTGGLDRPQLHFQIRFAPNEASRAEAVDPIRILPPR